MVLCKIPGKNFGKKIEYKTCDMLSLSGIKEAETLLSKGWIAGPSSIFRAQFYRYI